VFSSLTSIRASLLAKHSSDYWMDILSERQSRELSSLLAMLLSSSAPTSRYGKHSMTQSDDDSSDGEDDTEEEFGDSQDNEEITSNSESDSEQPYEEMNFRNRRRCLAKNYFDLEATED